MVLINAAIQSLTSVSHVLFKFGNVTSRLNIMLDQWYIDCVKHKYNSGLLY